MGDITNQDNLRHSIKRSELANEGYITGITSELPSAAKKTYGIGWNNLVSNVFGKTDWKNAKNNSEKYKINVALVRHRLFSSHMLSVHVPGELASNLFLQQQEPVYLDGKIHLGALGERFLDRSHRADRLLAPLPCRLHLFSCHSVLVGFRLDLPDMHQDIGRS